MPKLLTTRVRDMSQINAKQDVQMIMSHMSKNPITDSVAEFVPSEHIQRLSLSFDIDKLRGALQECLARVDYMGNMQEQGFAALPLTQRPGQTEWTVNDLSGRFWTRGDDRYVEEPREDLVPEIDFSEFNPTFSGTYFEEVMATLREHFPIGRTRILSKPMYNCNSWHRDPEPRLHIPIYTNPGALFAINHHLTHLPADGSVYFTDTRAYHTALNGGEQSRVHLVAALAYEQITE